MATFALQRADRQQATGHSKSKAERFETSVTSVTNRVNCGRFWLLALTAGLTTPKAQISRRKARRNAFNSVSWSCFCLLCHSFHPRQMLHIHSYPDIKAGFWIPFEFEVSKTRYPRQCCRQQRTGLLLLMAVDNVEEWGEGGIFLPSFFPLQNSRFIRYSATLLPNP